MPRPQVRQVPQARTMTLRISTMHQSSLFISDIIYLFNQACFKLAIKAFSE